MGTGNEEKSSTIEISFNLSALPIYIGAVAYAFPAISDDTTIEDFVEIQRYALASLHHLNRTITKGTTLQELITWVEGFLEDIEDAGDE